MAGVNLQNVGTTFVNYEQGFIETLNAEAKSFSMSKKRKWTGKNKEGRIHLAWSTALGMSEDGGAFPVEDKNDFTPYKVGRRFFHAKIGLTNGVIFSAKGSPNAAADVLQTEVRNMLTGAQKFYNGFFFRDGTGAVATVMAYSGGAADEIKVDDARMLWVGGTYQLYNSGGTLKGNLVVADIDQAVDTSGYSVLNVVTSHGLTPAATDILYWNNSKGKCISGLDTLVSAATTGTLQNVTLSEGANNRWSSMVLDNGTTKRELTPQLFRILLAGMKQKSGGKKYRQGLKVLGDSWQAIEFEEMYEGELRLTPASKTQGYASSSFQSALGRIDLECDTDALHDTLFAVDPGELINYTQKDLGWVREGKSIFKQSHTNAKKTAVMMCVNQLAIEDRRRCGRINDISTQATIAY